MWFNWNQNETFDHQRVVFIWQKNSRHLIQGKPSEKSSMVVGAHGIGLFLIPLNMYTCDNRRYYAEGTVGEDLKWKLQEISRKTWF